MFALRMVINAIPSSSPHATPVVVVLEIGRQEVGPWRLFEKVVSGVGLDGMEG
jgi:hypothetical protein